MWIMGLYDLFAEGLELVTKETFDVPVVSIITLHWEDSQKSPAET
jgi:hypothetical protein